MSEQSLFAFSPFTSAHMLQEFDAAGRGLRVAFANHGDRMAHAIAYVERSSNAERITELCASLEGAANETWPPSSPLQSLSIEQRASGNVALLVGMAGRSHWSASFATFAGSTRILVEHACRVSGEAERLGSGYRCPLDNVILETDNGQELFLSVGATRIRWRAKQIEIIGDANVLFPADQPWSAKPVRWQYELEIV